MTPRGPLVALSAMLLLGGAPAAGQGTAAAPTSNRESRSALPAPPLPGPSRFEEIGRFPAPEARQGVAVDARYFYTVGNSHIVKRDKRTGIPVAEWRGNPGGPAVHLNSCVVVAAGLVCAHSNYPGVPMVSSLEIWDPGTLAHRSSHSFGIYEGSLTWASRKDGDWWLNFAHYGAGGGVPGKGPEWTSLVRFGDDWARKAGYTYPAHFARMMAPYSASGGNWGADGRLYVTGHDQAAIYVLRVPEMGSVLEWVETIPAPLHGQAWVFDPVDPKVIWGIQRAAGVVVIGSLVSDR